jgi:zinc protease
MRRGATTRVAGAGLAACVLLAAAAPLGAAVRPPKLQYEISTLPNGLTVVLEEDHSTPIVHLNLTYHVGSKNEKPGRTGFAHLFEHLMFKGSKNVDPEGHTSMIASIGGQSNAYTTEDETTFWETAPSQYLPMLLWLEGDRMATLRINKETFTNERDVVKEERRLRIDNQPYGRLNEIIYEQVFTTHPYKHQPIGSMADLDAASVDDVLDFYRTFYVPENATLTLVGDIDPAQALQLVTQYLGRVPKAASAASRCRRRGPFRPSWWRITSPTTAILIRIRCTSPAKCCPMARARAFSRSWCTNSRSPLLRSAVRISSRIRTCSTPSRLFSRGARQSRRSTGSLPSLTC